MFRNVLNNQQGETAGVTQDVGADPTVGFHLCLLCGSVITCEGRSLVEVAPEDESDRGRGDDVVAVEDGEDWTFCCS